MTSTGVRFSWILAVAGLTIGQPGWCAEERLDGDNPIPPPPRVLDESPGGKHSQQVPEKRRISPKARPVSGPTPTPQPLIPEATEPPERVAPTPSVPIPDADEPIVNTSQVAREVVEEDTGWMWFFFVLVGLSVLIFLLL